jgi:hypothetical protein
VEARANEGNSNNMFWIDASSESSLELALMQIVQANNISQEAKPSATSALQWISKRANWLIVYDSADGHYSVVEKFLPPGIGGNVLISSRNPGLKRMTLDKNSLEVLDMTNEEGISLLLKSAMLDGTSEHIMILARKLVSELGGIPLAIDQAGGYMLSCGCCYNTVRTPTLCKPDTLDRPCYFLFNLLNLAMPLTTYAVHLVLLIFVLLPSLPCYLYDTVLILTSDILYSLIDTFLSILRYISTHVFVVEP